MSLAINKSLSSEINTKPYRPELNIKKQTLKKYQKLPHLVKANSNTESSTIGCSIEKSIGLESSNLNMSNETINGSLSAKIDLNIKKNKIGRNNIESGKLSPCKDTVDVNSQDSLIKLKSLNTFDMEVKRTTLRRGPSKC